MIKRCSFRASGAIAAAVLLPGLAQAQLSVASPSDSYLQDFSSLATAGATVPWVNDTTLADWSLFDLDKAALSTYAAGDASP